MKRWDYRPLEIRNLFNPAFCALVLFRALHRYEEEDSHGMPFSLSLLVLPLCLHKESRQIISGNSRSYLLKIAEKNQHIKIGFADRVTNMLPYTFEGVGFLMERACIKVSDSGRLKTLPNKVRKTVRGTEETIACQRVARKIGEEFGRIADRATIYTTFGIRI